MTPSSRIRGLRLAAITALILLAPIRAQAQRPVELAPNAPKDKPATVDDCRWKMFVKATAPFVEKARASFPGAAARFRAGLPRGETFFVTTRITDSLGHFEQVFVAVDSVVGPRIVGRIWSQVELVKGYRYRQRYEMREDAVVDWMISKPDGTEEGNEVGKFLDTYTPPTTCGRV